MSDFPGKYVIVEESQTFVIEGAAHIGLFAVGGGENSLKKSSGDKPDLDELEQQLDTGTLIQKSNAKM